jgi:ribosomal subunit interface protein
MNVEIRSPGMAVTAGLRARVERRAQFTLDRFVDRMARVTVRFSDANGPRGGEDKTCAIEVTLRGTAPVRVSATASDLYVAIDRAFHKAAYSIGRVVQRERQELIDLLTVTRATESTR